jgi:hypothetical protein
MAQKNDRVSWNLRAERVEACYCKQRLQLSVCRLSDLRRGERSPNFKLEWPNRYASVAEVNWTNQS